MFVVHYNRKNFRQIVAFVSIAALVLARPLQLKADQASCIAEADQQLQAAIDACKTAWDNAMPPGYGQALAAALNTYNTNIQNCDLGYQTNLQNCGASYNTAQQGCGNFAAAAITIATAAFIAACALCTVFLFGQPVCVASAFVTYQIALAGVAANLAVCLANAGATNTTCQSNAANTRDTCYTQAENSYNTAIQNAENQFAQEKAQADADYADCVAAAQAAHDAAVANCADE